MNHGERTLPATGIGPRGAGLSRALSLSLLANHHPALHGLRVVAIVSVLQVHVTVVLASHGLLRDPAFARLSTTIFFGMDCFFAMSGFLIGKILFHSLATPGRARIGRFYLRRAFRTFPLYYACLLGYAALVPLSAAQKQSLFWEASYLTNYTPNPTATLFPWGWSLCVEEHFYLAIPLLVGALTLVRSHRARVGLLAALWASALCVRLFVYARGAGTWNDGTMMLQLYVRTHTRYDILVAGLFVAYLDHARGDALRAWLATATRRRALLALSAASLLFLLAPSLFGNSHLWSLFAWGTATSTLYVPLLLYLVAADGPAHRALGHPVLLRVATLGYGVYLIHVPILERVVLPIARATSLAGGPITAVWPATLAALLALSLGGSYLLHVVVEKPFLWLRDRVAP